MIDAIEKSMKITNRLREDFDIVTNKGYTCLGVFLHGSQNYGLDSDESDIDTIAIVVPKFEDFILNKGPVSETHVHLNGEQIDIKDIRTIFNMFKKQNPSYLEILFTPYKYIDKDYSYYFSKIIENAELIARYDTKQAMNTLVGTIKQFNIKLQLSQNTFEECDYSPKQLCNLLRYKEFLDKFVAGKTYQECLKSDMVEHFIAIKTTKPPLYDFKTACEMSTRVVHQAEEIERTFIPTENRDVVDSILLDVLSEIIRHSFRKGITNE